MAWDSTKTQRSRGGDWVSRDFVHSLELGASCSGFLLEPGGLIFRSGLDAKQYSGPVRLITEALFLTVEDGVHGGWVEIMLLSPLFR